MNKDTVNGKVNVVAGRAKRQVGEWTGDTKTQAEGAGQEIKGHVQNVVGKVKDAVNHAADDAKRASQKAEAKREDEDVRYTGTDHRG